MAEKIKQKVRMVFRPLQAFFFEEKNGVYAFTTKKFYAFIFVSLAVYEKLVLVAYPATHWSVMLTQKGVPDSTIAIMSASFDVVALGALSVYGWAKVRGAV